MNTAPVDTSTVSQPIQKGGGESPVTFDELEAVDRFKSEVKQNEIKEEKEAEKLVVKGERKVEKKDKSETETAGKKTAESKEKKPQNDDKAEKAIEQKKLKVKHGESDLELDLDLELPVKVNGKLEKVKLQEAINRYSSQKHLDDLYHTIKKEREEFHSQRDSLQSIARKAKEALSQKDFRSFMEMVAQATGDDPGKLYQETVENLRTQLEEAARLSPEERMIKQLQEENEYFKRKEQSAAKEAESKKAFQETSQKVEAVIKSTGMSKSDFVKAFDELVSMGHDAKGITADHVGKYYSNYKLIEAIDSKLRDVNPELPGFEDKVQQIAQYAIQTGAGIPEIEAAIDLEYGNAARLKREIDKKQKKAEKQTPVRNPMKDPLFFDDLG